MGFNKPFRAPLMSKPPTVQNHAHPQSEDEPPTKRRRLSPEPTTENKDPGAPHRDSHPSVRLAIAHKPLHQIRPTASEPAIQNSSHEVYYNVVWRKFTNKKNKTWEGDGVLAVKDGIGILTDSNGQNAGRTRINGPLTLDTEISMAGKEVLIESIMTSEEFLTGVSDQQAKPRQSVSKIERKPVSPMLAFIKGVSEPSINLGQPVAPAVGSKKFVQPVGSATASRKPIQQASLKIASKISEQPVRLTQTMDASAKIAQSSYKNPVLGSTIMPKTHGPDPTPRHDPNAPNALVMKRTQNIPNGKRVVDVVVDPKISRLLREHQREGVKFLYECVMGMRPFSGDGAILADEMGLGKTLQVIALLWTLMKQNPIAGENPVVKKALIVCPVSLIKNWQKEFRKWLGRDGLGVLAVEDKDAKLKDFTNAKSSYNVLLVGFERLRTIAPELQKNGVIDIVIADEGHRLKTAANKSGQAIKAFSTTRRIVLSGTPIQNELSEFYFVVDFINPGLLGKYQIFKRDFETPISQGRRPEATSEEQELGNARFEELMALCAQFMLRRSADLLAKYLPPKTEYFVFCRPTSLQAEAYNTVCKSSAFTSAAGASDCTLQLLNILRKLCNAPSLLKAKEEKEDSVGLTSAIVSSLPAGLIKNSISSGKMVVLDNLLYQIRKTTNEKVVIVSHFTAMLDKIMKMLDSVGYTHLRLDGSTTQKKRQELVDKFNRTDAETSFVFLLSAKAGGVGINLIGASRLIMFDNDWNPSVDAQAMARTHRDGQKRPCRIYRLITKGALDEKILQRQTMKLSLSDSLVDGKVSANSFSQAELRDLYRLDEAGNCQTHALLGCSCGGRGYKDTDMPSVVSSPAKSASDASMVCVDDEVEDDEEFDPTSSQFIKGSQVDDFYRKPAKEQKTRKEKSKMLALMQYRHFDAMHLTAPRPVLVDEDGYKDIDAEFGTEEELLDDDVLMSVIKHEESLVSYVFAKGAAA